MPQLTLNNVTKVYGEKGLEHHALRGVCVDVEPGEFVALRGPSGCGKSTLLHIAGAMDRPTKGEVFLGGKALHRLGDDQLARIRRRGVGFIFQAYNLLPTLTAVENAALPLLLDRVERQQSIEAAENALLEVGLAAKMQSYPSQLSGGELQRVAIARAVAVQPEIVVADEPTGSLDSENGARVLQLLERLNRTRGLTVLMATHSDDAASCAGRVLNLADGLLEPARTSDAIIATL